MHTDRNLLFGMLAHQLDFLGRDALIEGFREWLIDQHTPLAEILCDLGYLSEMQIEQVEAAVDAQLVLQNGEAAAAPSTRAPDQTWVQQAPEGKSPAAVGAATSEGTRFRILRPLDRGGLGVVSIALDTELHREVVLKEIKTSEAHHADTQARFLLEAEVTGALEHPGVVPVYGLGRYADGRPFYAMRFIRGDNLMKAIQRFHGQSPTSHADFTSVEFRQLLRRFLDVCNAIAYAHSRGVIHRDLKPGNIMLGEFGETLVVDWGLAKLMRKEETARAEADSRPDGSLRLHQSSRVRTLAGTAVGTPAFMSPEQAAGRLEAIGPPTDVYSLGATLYCMVTGHSPFQDPNLEDVLRCVEAGRFPRPRQVQPAVPRPLEAICLKAMAVNPTERYANVMALARDVEQWLADEPTSAWREPLRVRAARWTRRRRTLVASGLVAFVVLFVSALGGLYLQGAAEQRAAGYRLTLLRSAESSEQIGLAEVHAGRFAGAETIFRRAAERLQDEPELRQVHDRLLARRERAHRLAEFYRLVDRGERLIVHDLDREVRAAFEGALAALGSREEDDWWTHLPVDDLTDVQIRRLKRDVHLRWLILAGIRGRQGPMSGFDPARTKEGFESALRAIAAAQRFEPCQVGLGLEALVGFGLGRRPDLKKLAESRPTGFADYYLTGVMHHWLAEMPKDWMHALILLQATGLSQLDLVTPRKTAERHLRMAATLDPEHFWTYYWLGTALNDDQRPGEAELAFAACIGLRPDYADGYIERATTLLAQIKPTDSKETKDRLFARAMADLDAAARVEATSEVVRFERGKAYADRGEEAKALAEFTEAIRLSALTESSPWRYRHYFHRGALHVRQREYDLAIADFEKALPLFPRQIQGAGNREDRLHAYLAFALAAKGDSARALESYDRAIRLRPEGEYFGSRGEVYAARGEHARAIADYTEAIKRRPLAGYHLARARLFKHLQDYTAAIQDCSAALRLEPGNVVALSVRAHCRAALADWNGCRDDLEKTIERQPATGTPAELNAWMDAWIRLGIVNVRCGDLNAYRRLCSEALARFGERKEIIHGLATLLTLGPEAVSNPQELTRLADQLAKEGEDSARQGGFVLYRSGQFEAALQKLTPASGATASNDYTPVTWFFLAMSCHRLGRAEEAKAWLARAVDYVQGLGKPGESQTNSERVSPYYRAQLESLRREVEALVASSSP